MGTQDIGVIAALVTAVVALVALIKDHKRRRAQATHEVYISISKEANKLRNYINLFFPNEEVIEPNDSRYNNKELQLKISRLLALYEQISVGINLNIWDLGVFMRIAGRSSINWYKRLKPVIEKVREESDWKTVYGDFEELSNKMVEKYEKHPRKYAPQTKYTKKRGIKHNLKQEVAL